MAFEIFDEFTSGIPDYAVSAFNAIDPWFWPLVFIGIIGFVYAAMSSVTLAVIAILITFGMFATTTTIFVDVPEISLFLYIIAVIGITVLIAALFISWRRK